MCASKHTHEHIQLPFTIQCWFKMFKEHKRFSNITENDAQNRAQRRTLIHVANPINCDLRLSLVWLGFKMFDFEPSAQILWSNTPIPPNTYHTKRKEKNQM